MLDTKEERIIRASLNGRIEDAQSTLRELERLQAQINEQIKSAQIALERAKQEKTKTLEHLWLDDY